MGNKLGDLSSTQVRLAAIFAINNGIFSIKKKKEIHSKCIGKSIISRINCYVRYQYSKVCTRAKDGSIASELHSSQVSVELIMIQSHNIESN